jgi:hypothetical protein
MHATPENDEMAPELLSLLLPLHYFYAKEDRPLPAVQLLDGADLPEPEQSLLVHDRDMTSTLKNFHGSPITLEVRSVERADDYVMRMVVLHRQDTGAPVEFGAIGIRLDKFEGPLREQIAEGRAPLGGLLEKYIVDYRSCPKGYFSTQADQLIASALAEAEGATVYGRCNELTDAEGFAFADIVEVLPRARP